MESEPLWRPPSSSGRSSRAGSQTLFQYYDPDAIFHIKPDVVTGYYTLLGGQPEADLTVAYFSLIDGNVLQSVFGLSRTRVYLSNFQGDVTRERRIVYAYATLFRLCVSLFAGVQRSASALLFDGVSSIGRSKMSALVPQNPTTHNQITPQQARRVPSGTSVRLLVLPTVRPLRAVLPPTPPTARHAGGDRRGLQPIGTGLDVDIR